MTIVKLNDFDMGMIAGACVVTLIQLLLFLVMFPPPQRTKEK